MKDSTQAKILELEKANKELLDRLMGLMPLIEELIVFAFAISELRNLWRRKFGLPQKGEV